MKPRDTRPVPKRNVDVVREHIGDVDLAAILRDDDAWAARLADIEPHFAADFEFVARVPGTPIRGRGFVEFREMFLDWIEPWAAYRPSIAEIVDLGDRVVVFGRDRGTMKHTGQEVDGPRGMVLYHFGDGRVTRIEYWFNRDAGRAAVGL
jgi:ketosteroid isomerase-like protein